MNYSALSRKEILTPAITWINPKDIVLSEISQSQRTNTVGFHIYVKCIETGSRMGAARGWGSGSGGLVFNGYTVSVRTDEKFWRWAVGVVAQERECAQCYRTVCLQWVRW